MKKILLFFIVALFLAMTTVSATICEDRTEIGDIPCEVITPYLNCTDYIYNLTNISSGNLLIINGSMSPIGNGTYNFTFNQTLGSYQITLCDTTTGIIEVITDMNYFILAILVVAILLLVLSKITGDFPFEIFSGILFLIFGFFNYFNPIISVSTMADNAISFVIFGIGLFLLFNSIFKLLDRGGV